MRPWCQHVVAVRWRPLRSNQRRGTSSRAVQSVCTSDCNAVCVRAGGVLEVLNSWRCVVEAKQLSMMMLLAQSARTAATAAWHLLALVPHNLCNGRVVAERDGREQMMLDLQHRHHTYVNSAPKHSPSEVQPSAAAWEHRMTGCMCSRTAAQANLGVLLLAKGCLVSHTLLDAGL